MDSRMSFLSTKRTDCFLNRGLKRIAEIASTWTRIIKLVPFAENSAKGDMYTPSLHPGSTEEPFTYDCPFVCSGTRMTSKFSPERLLHYSLSKILRGKRQPLPHPCQDEHWHHRQIQRQCVQMGVGHVSALCTLSSAWAIALIFKTYYHELLHVDPLVAPGDSKSPSTVNDRLPC